MPEDHGSRIVLLVAPTPDIATTLAQRFEKTPGVRIIEDRRRTWPRGERRRMLQEPAVERRRGDRRQTSRFRFEGSLIEAMP